jgi:hypothetical protein
MSDAGNCCAERDLFPTCTIPQPSGQLTTHDQDWRVLRCFVGIDHCYLGIRYKTPNADWCAQDALFAMFIRSPSMRNQALSENVARNAVLI